MLALGCMRKAMFAYTLVASVVAGVVVACGGSGGSGDLTATDGGASSSSSSGSTSSSGGTGSSSSSGGPSGVYAPAQPGQGTAYCDGSWNKISNALMTCCSEEDKKTFEWAFAGGLVIGLFSTCGPRLEASIAKGRLETDAAAAASCYATWNDLTSQGCAGGALGISTTIDPAKLKDGLEDCKLVFRGLVAENGACSMDADCIDGLTCVGWNKDVEGTCKQPGGLNEACGTSPADGGFNLAFPAPVGTHPECAAGFYCSARKCVAQKNPGESCTDDDQCLGGKLCRLGVCGDIGDADQNGACKENDDCKSGLYCQTPGAGQQGTCQPKLGTGGACSTSNASCKGRCDRPDSGTTGTCVPFCGSG